MNAAVWILFFGCVALAFFRGLWLALSEEDFWSGGITMAAAVLLLIQGIFGPSYQNCEPVTDDGEVVEYTCPLRWHEIEAE